MRYAEITLTFKKGQVPVKERINTQHLNRRVAKWTGVLITNASCSYSYFILTRLSQVSTVPTQESGFFKARHWWAH